MKKTVKLTLEQFNRLLEEGVTYDVDSAVENPRVLSAAQQDNSNISVANVNSGNNSEEPAIVTSDVDEVGDTVAQLKTQNLNAEVVVPANGADTGELARAESDAKNAGADVNEMCLSKKSIIEMRSAYLRENTKTYTKKGFLRK